VFGREGRGAEAGSERWDWPSLKYLFSVRTKGGGMKNNNHNNTVMAVGDARAAAVSVKEKRQKKTKKQNEKEILLEYYASLEDATPVAPPSPDFIIKPLKFTATAAKNPTQEKLVRILNDKTKKIIFITGPAGTGKTLLATETGIQHWFAGTYKKLVFTRPNIAVDEELGFLPGTLEEKLGPYVRPIYDILYTFLCQREVAALIEEKIIEVAPLGFMRGRTFKNTWIVADEMQNATVSQMKMLLTRIGENSQLVITGDLEQSDIGACNGLQDFLQKWATGGTAAGSFLSHVHFEQNDILREPVVQEILNIYSVAR
jgi:phosphate starvation-inducible PhoH-like protein